jgi:hypothetical protein
VIRLAVKKGFKRYIKKCSYCDSIYKSEMSKSKVCDFCKSLVKKHFMYHDGNPGAKPLSPHEVNWSILPNQAKKSYDGWLRYRRKKYGVRLQK